MTFAREAVLKVRTTLVSTTATLWWSDDQTEWREVISIYLQVKLTEQAHLKGQYNFSPDGKSTQSDGEAFGESLCKYDFLPAGRTLV